MHSDLLFCIVIKAAYHDTTLHYWYYLLSAVYRFDSVASVTLDLPVFLQLHNINSNYFCNSLKIFAKTYNCFLNFYGNTSVKIPTIIILDLYYISYNPLFLYHESSLLDLAHITYHISQLPLLLVRQLHLLIIIHNNLTFYVGIFKFRNYNLINFDYIRQD